MITVRGLWRIFGKYSSSSRVVVEYLNAMTARAPCGANNVNIEKWWTAGTDGSLSGVDQITSAIQ